MHEMGIALDVLETAEASLPRETPHRILSVRLRMGPFAGVDPECLRFAFAVLTDDRPACRGATLEIVETGPAFRCRHCGTEGAFEPAALCPACGGTDVDVLGGDEIVLLSIEAEETTGEA